MQMNNADSKKRPHMPHELFGKFKSKADFLCYFEENRKYINVSIVN